MSVTNYNPNKCRYSVGRLKKVAYLFSESDTEIAIDNGVASAFTFDGTFQHLSGSSITFNESTSYNDRYSFDKTFTITVNGYLRIEDLNKRYYIILQDLDDNYWLVNYDFPAFVTYEYNLNEATNETVFTFKIQSNFPTLQLEINLAEDVSPCKQYDVKGIDSLKLLEAYNALYSVSGRTVYVQSGSTFKDVKFNEGTCSLKESFDGNYFTDEISFSIDMDSYKSSWHYNICEYPLNRYMALVDSKTDGEFLLGVDNGLVPGYSIQASTDGSDVITVTLSGTSTVGSLLAGYGEETADARWLIVDENEEYVWKLSDEYVCQENS